MTLLSMGVPMLLMGDEVRRTQDGNNNGYCHDDATAWFDWSLLDRHADVHDWTRGLIATRKRVQQLLGDLGDLTLTQLLERVHVVLSGTRVGEPDLGPESRSFALTLQGAEAAVHLMFNAWWQELEFEVPPIIVGGAGWRCVVDTTSGALPVAWADALPVDGQLPAGSTLDGVPGGPGRDVPGMTTDEAAMTGAERARMQDAGNPEEGLESASPWYRWGPYLSERAWGSVREDYSASGDAWSYFPHDHARSRAYRWNEDGMAGISDVFNRMCLGLAIWNGRDPILKERMFGLTNGEGNHGEDAKEYWWYLDAVPSSSWLRWRYHYPQAAFPYERARRRERAAVQAGARVRAPGHRHLRRRPLLDRRGPLRQGGSRTTC